MKVDVTKIGPWSKVGKLLEAAPRRMKAAFDKALLQEAQFLRTEIVEGIREQAPGGRAFAPLAPPTIAIRQFRAFRGIKPLIVQGDLRNSITVVKDGDRVLVGVFRAARNRNGKSLVDIAALQEYGSRPIVFRLTPKARAFLHAAFRHAGLDGPDAGRPGTGIAVIHPAVPVPCSGVRAGRPARPGFATLRRARRRPPQPILDVREEDTTRRSQHGCREVVVGFYLGLGLRNERDLMMQRGTATAIVVFAPTEKRTSDRKR